jgi:hypothetical protein
VIGLILVWTKSLVCKDALSQGFHYPEVLQKIFGSLSAVRTTCHPVQTLIYLLFHPSGRSAIPSGHQTDLQMTLFPSEPSLCREAYVQLASVRTAQQPVRTPLNTRPISYSFQVPIKGRSIQPFGQCGIPSGRASP